MRTTFLAMSDDVLYIDDLMTEPRANLSENLLTFIEQYSPLVLANSLSVGAFVNFDDNNISAVGFFVEDIEFTNPYDLADAAKEYCRHADLLPDDYGMPFAVYDPD